LELTDGLVEKEKQSFMDNNKNIKNRNISILLEEFSFF
jgi:hypothetical protein